MKKKSKIIISTIVICLIITITSVILYFALRPDIKYIKFSSIEMQNTYSYVYLSIYINTDFITFSATDFAIYSNDKPISASQFNDGWDSEESLTLTSSGEYNLMLKFDISKYKIDTPIKITYKGDLIT